MKLGTAARFEQHVDRHLSSEWCVETVESPQNSPANGKQFAVIVFEESPAKNSPVPHATIPSVIQDISEGEPSVEAVAVYTNPRTLSEKQVCYVLDDGKVNRGGVLGEDAAPGFELIASLFDSVELDISHTVFRHSINRAMLEYDSPRELILASQDDLQNAEELDPRVIEIISSRFSDGVIEGLRSGFNLHELPLTEDDGVFKIDSGLDSKVAELQALQ
jgi:hypothetical protein